jgi:quercetin dioxygenase-like cupin family protein
MVPRFSAVLIGLTLASASAQDSKVEVDNTWVHAVRVKQGPHQKSAVHQHPPTVVVYLTDTRQRITGADGKAQQVSHKAGEVAYFDAATRAEENVSDQPLEMIVVELKPGAPKSQPIALDPVKLDPEHHLVPLENARVRVLRTILEPHLKSPMHEHPHYVVVYLTELHTTMTLGDGRQVDNPRRPGEVAWRDYLKHETENIGDKTAVEIQIELK